MTRLTQQMRNTIVSKAITHAYAAKIKSARLALCAAGDAVYFAVMSPEIRKHVDALPRIAFRWDSELDVNAGYLGVRRCVLSEARPQFYARCTIDDVNRATIEAYDAASAAEHTLRKERDTEQERLRTVLSGFATLARLESEWPEICSLLPAGSVASVPAQTIAALNEKLGLPA